MEEFKLGLNSQLEYRRQELSITKASKDQLIELYLKLLKTYLAHVETTNILLKEKISG